MTELKPCPFCGGEAEYGITFAGEEVYCKKCHAAMPRVTTEAEAVAAWNTRHQCGLTDEDYNILLDELGVSERTCEFVSSKGSDYPPVCSACGYELGIYDCAWYEDGTYGYERNYCPNCGGHVVDGKEGV